MIKSTFISDRSHLAALEGQRYIVLRPSDAVVEEFENVRSSLHALIDGDAVSSPSFPHVTFIGFPSGTSLEDVQEMAARWAEQNPPLPIEIQGTSTFPPPFQTVIVQVTKTPSLTTALRAIRQVSADIRLPQWPERRPSIEDWIFHMSVAYCSKLPQHEWEVVVDEASKLSLGSASCLATEAEVVAYDGLEERPGGTFQFKRSGRRES